MVEPREQGRLTEPRLQTYTRLERELESPQAALPIAPLAFPLKLANNRPQARREDSIFHSAF